MKKFLLTVFLLIPVMMVLSCSKEKMNERNIIGKWQSTQVTYEIFVNDRLGISTTEFCDEWYLAMSFKEDGTGQIIVQDKDGATDIEAIKWALLKNELFITVYGESQSCDVVSMEKNEMILSISEEEDLLNGAKRKDVVKITFRKL